MPHKHHRILHVYCPNGLSRRVPLVSSTWSCTYFHVVLYQSDLHLTGGNTMSIHIVIWCHGSLHMVLHTLSYHDLSVRLAMYLPYWRHHKWLCYSSNTKYTYPYSFTHLNNSKSPILDFTCIHTMHHLIHIVTHISHR